MKKATLPLLFLCLLSQSIFAQRHDNTWYLGYPGNSALFGPIKVTFDNGSFVAEKDTTIPWLQDSNNTVFSDSSGNYLAAFNGFWVCDKTGKKMLNGDSIYYDTLPYLYGYSDDDIPQGGMFLPWPGHPDSILLFYTSQGNAAWPGWADLACLNLYYAIIQLSGNDGKGAVVAQRNEVIADTIQYGRLTATKHANGRDWWILINERNSNRFYNFLLDPYGVRYEGEQSVFLPLIDGLGQAAFSPDGNYYAVKNSVSTTVGNYVDVFSFDRCTGQLSNQIQLYQPGSAVGGLAFSPNSRFLYVSFRTSIYQYDMFADDIDSTKALVGVFEFDSTQIPATFFTMQLAPDNKIYLCATNTLKYLHVIHQPDQPGLACLFVQKGTPLPTKNYSSVSFSPNYRLGPLDDSPCDTLSLNNQPVAWWRSEQDTLDPLSIAFFDLAYYEPATWHWSFGDGATSEEQNPLHSYDSTGIYQVCLTVSNDYGADTLCRTLYLGVSTTYSPEAVRALVSISPNPFTHRIRVQLHESVSSTVFRLYDQMGRLVRAHALAYGLTDMETADLPTGLYFWEVRSGGELVKVGKAVKVE